MMKRVGMNENVTFYLFFKLKQLTFNFLPLFDFQFFTHDQEVMVHRYFKVDTLQLIRHVYPTFIASLDEINLLFKLLFLVFIAYLFLISIKLKILF